MPQQLKIDKERQRELELLIAKHEQEHGKKIQRNQELPFKALMQMRSQLPHFYFDWRKDRTKLLRKKEPAARQSVQDYLTKLRKDLRAESIKQKKQYAAYRHGNEEERSQRSKSALS